MDDCLEEICLSSGFYAFNAALAVVHYKLNQLEDSQDLYARAYDIQASHCSLQPRTLKKAFLPLVLPNLQLV